MNEFFLSKLNLAANLERDFQDKARQLVLAYGEVELAELLRDHGEEIIASNARALAIPRPTAKERSELPFTASNFFALRDAFNADDQRTYLCGVDALICIGIATSANEEGWARLRQKTIAAQARTEKETARQRLRILRARHVIVTREPGKLCGLDEQFYKIQPMSQWLAEEKRNHESKNSAKPAVKRIEARAAVGPKSSRLWLPGEQAPIELGRAPRMAFEREDGSRAARVELAPGSALFRFPEGSKTIKDDAPPVPGHQVGSSTPPVPGHRGNEIGADKIPPVPGHQVGSSTPPVPGHRLTIAIQTFDGLVTGCAPEKHSWTAAEEQNERGLGGGALAAFLRTRGVSDAVFHPRQFKNSRACGTNPRALAGAISRSAAESRIGAGPRGAGAAKPEAIERARRREEAREKTG